MSDLCSSRTRKREHWYCQIPCTHDDSQSVRTGVLLASVTRVLCGALRKGVFAGKCHADVSWSIVERRVAGKCYGVVLCGALRKGVLLARVTRVLCGASWNIAGEASSVTRRKEPIQKIIRHATSEESLRASLSPSFLARAISSPVACLSSCHHNKKNKPVQRYHTSTIFQDCVGCGCVFLILFF